MRVCAGARHRRPRSLRHMIPQDRGSAVILDDVRSFDRVISAGRSATSGWSRAVLDIARNLVAVVTGTPYSDGLPGLRIMAMLREGLR